MTRKVRWAAFVAAVVVALVVWLWPFGGRKVIRGWVDSWGQPPPGRFYDPEGMAIDSEGNVYVADEENGIFWILDRDGKTLWSGEGLTSGDSMVVVAPMHVIAISNVHNLTEFKVENGKATIIRSISKRGHGDGEFEDPEGISMADGEIYATDEDHRRVLVFDREGKYLRAIKVPHDPEAVCVFEDRVYVTFSKDGYVGCYGKDGTRKFEFGHGVLEEPDYAIVGPDRQLYISDQKGGHKIEVFDLDGKSLRRIGRKGSGDGEFMTPEDLAFDRDGNLVVADGWNRRLQVLTRDGKFLRQIR